MGNRYTKKKGRKFSSFEMAALKVLKESGKPLSIREITQLLIKKKYITTQGKTPAKSLYSLIHKHEKMRQEKGEKMLFKKTYIGTRVKYSAK